MTLYCIHSLISILYDFDLLYYDIVMGEGVPLVVLCAPQY